MLKCHKFSVKIKNTQIFELEITVFLLKYLRIDYFVVRGNTLFC